MSYLICNNKGISMIEVAIAIFIVAIGVVGVLAVHPQGWALSTKTDYIGRAAELLHSELERQQLRIMNGCNNITAGTTGPTTTYSSGGTSSQTGDVAYNVTVSVADASGFAAADMWTVRVTVTWTGNATGISDAILVGRQSVFRGGC